MCIRDRLSGVFVILKLSAIHRKGLNLQRLRRQTASASTAALLIDFTIRFGIVLQLHPPAPVQQRDHSPFHRPPLSVRAVLAFFVLWVRVSAFVCAGGKTIVESGSRVRVEVVTGPSAPPSSVQTN